MPSFVSRLLLVALLWSAVASSEQLVVCVRTGGHAHVDEVLHQAHGPVPGGFTAAAGELAASPAGATHCVDLLLAPRLVVSDHDGGRPAPARGEALRAWETAPRRPGASPPVVTGSSHLVSHRSVVLLI